MFLFGYGSLMWDGWEVPRGGVNKGAAVLIGFQRDFNKASVRNWGSRDRPGPTLGLTQFDGATCLGVVFELPDAKADAALEGLRTREGKSFRFEEHVVQLATGETVTALVPVNDVNSSTFLGRLPIDERARMAAVAHGASGACVDYVRNVQNKLEELQIRDAVVEDFARRVDEALGAAEAKASQ